jgi:predicted DNA-binding transcriptional regulator AlpA
MNSFLSTRHAARKLGIDPTTLSRYIATGKVPPPKVVQFGGMRVHGWTEEEIERVRKLLPKIANGRKTRYQKQGKKPKKRKSRP